MKTNQLYIVNYNCKLPYCLRNEYDVKRFINRTESFFGGKIMLIVLWSTRNIKSSLPLKDKVAHRPCVIYEGKCLVD